MSKVSKEITLSRQEVKAMSQNLADAASLEANEDGSVSFSAKTFQYMRVLGKRFELLLVPLVIFGIPAGVFTIAMGIASIAQLSGVEIASGPDPLPLLAGASLFLSPIPFAVKAKRRLTGFERQCAAELKSWLHKTYEAEASLASLTNYVNGFTGEFPLESKNGEKYVLNCSKGEYRSSPKFYVSKAGILPVAKPVANNEILQLDSFQEDRLTIFSPEACDLLAQIRELVQKLQALELAPENSVAVNNTISSLNETLRLEEDMASLTGESRIGTPMLTSILKSLESELNQVVISEVAAIEKKLSHQEKETYLRSLSREASSRVSLVR